VEGVVCALERVASVDVGLFRLPEREKGREIESKREGERVRERERES